MKEEKKCYSYSFMREVRIVLEVKFDFQTREEQTNPNLAGRSFQVRTLSKTELQCCVINGMCLQY
jgi:hypothetical protein